MPNDADANTDVIAGLVPVIPITRAQGLENRDGRVKPGHDDH